MALNATGIAAGIAALTITGITVKDIDTISDRINPRDCPLLMPNPNSWISGGIGTSEAAQGPATFGPGMWVFERAFSYLYLHAQIGSGRGLNDHMSGMSDNLDAILTAMVGLNIAGVDVMQLENSDFNVVTDPTGQQFYGFGVVITLKERVNA